MDAILSAYFSDQNLHLLVKVALTTGAVLVLSRVAISFIARAFQPRFGQTGRLLVQRLLWYPVLVLIISNALSSFGIDISVLLGAAGVLTVAAGFAAQTSAANVISGIFLLGERPFAVGDVIKFEDITGTVVSIDLLSIKLCTFDNLLVRLPNEIVLKTRLTNLSHFKIRRIDVPICIAQDADFHRAIEVLKQTTNQLSTCLDEPEPTVIYDAFSSGGQAFKFCVWGQASDYLALKNDFHASANRALRESGIELAVQPITVRYSTPDMASP